MKKPMNARANKDLGQHFLVDEGIIDQITSDHKDEADDIIEVGPGPGALTQKLSQIEKPLSLIEMDNRFKKSLTQFCPVENIHFGDAVDFDLDSITGPEKKTWMVSNLPYNVSSILFIKFLQVPNIHYMTLMFQKEVGVKTVDIPQKKSSLLCLSHNYFETSVLCQVPPESFSPPPRVKSIVISYKRRESPIIPLDEFTQFQSFLRKLFQFKRKKMLGILKTAYTEIVWPPIYDKLQIDQNIRAEALEFESIRQLYMETK